jgi:hypothetical protein
MRTMGLAAAQGMGLPEADAELAVRMAEPRAGVTRVISAMVWGAAGLREV